jgi:sigma-B regulation protein RsbU (phosphoserine phosphatase)
LKQGNLVWLRHPHKTISFLPEPLDRLQQAGLWVCVPLLSGEELLGLYGLGPKKSGEYYRREEVTLLETLARQAGIAFKNAQLHKALSAQVRIQRDLEIARQIQLSLLPAQDPQMLGLDIVGFSIPAQEVGGDFYHYFKFDEDRIGIAVGDVSGKGVAAALFMAVSISTLRAQSPHHRHPAHLITEMNDLLHLQMKVRKMNTALLYLIIERQDGGALTLDASNAGLISPLLRRAHRKTEYIDVRGLPLGVMEQIEYKACRVNLEQGDLLVLCSDGIVEALNERGEMFGFQRLEQFMVRCDNLSAGQVVERLHREVDSFVGKAEQHDDITMVAIRVR